MAQCSVRSSTRNLSQRLLQKSKASAQSFSSSAGRCTQTTTGSTLAPSQEEPLTLWHKTTKVLPKALASRPPANQLSVDTWERVLSRAFDDLSGGSDRPVKLLVHGIGRQSGAEDFVASLVTDPLGPEEQWKTVQGRWEGGGNQLTISHGSELSLAHGALSLPSTYIQRFKVPIEITELKASSPSTASTSRLPIIDNSTLSRLFEADIPIILCNPLTTPINQLLSITLPTKTIIIIRAPSTQSLDVTELLSSVPSFAPKPTIVLADPSRASKAIELLQSNSTSSAVVQQFQDEYTGSNVSAVARILQDLLHAPETRDTPAKQHQLSKTPGSASDYLRIKFALLRLEDALAACLTSIEDIKLQLDAASIKASELSDQVEETSTRVELDVLGPAGSTYPPARNTRGNEVTEALLQAEKQMQEVMSRFTWWRMVSRVDEITSLISSALQRTWCPELERKLLLQTGQLSALQKELSKKSFELLSNNNIVQSNVLRNTLLQLQSSPNYELNTTSLTSAITSRRNQIIEYPTARLHLVGQRTVLGMSGGICGGAAIGWTGWMGWLVQSGDGLLGSIGLDPNTAMAIGALSAVASVRWGVGKWERAKKKWWEDWHRVGEGLDRDLRATLHQNFTSRVAVLAQASSQGVKAKIERREEAISKVNDEVKELRDSVKVVAEQS